AENMFSHLKAEDFVNLMEGAEPSAKQRGHIQACPQCRETWESMRSVHAEITSPESDIPEPDWAQFRSSVRDELLSRSIQRQSAVRRWTGWTVRPAVAWALSLLMAIGVTTTVLWTTSQRTQPAAPAVLSPTASVDQSGEPATSAPEALEPALERSL